MECTIHYTSVKCGEGVSDTDSSPLWPAMGKSFVSLTDNSITISSTLYGGWLRLGGAGTNNFGLGRTRQPAQPCALVRYRG